MMPHKWSWKGALVLICSSFMTSASSSDCTVQIHQRQKENRTESSSIQKIIEKYNHTVTHSMASTAVELRQISESQVQLTARQSDPQPEPDNVLESSRLADSTVPDGGYGWAVIAGCAVMTWHVSLHFIVSSSSSSSWD